MPKAPKLVSVTVEYLDPNNAQCVHTKRFSAPVEVTDKSIEQLACSTFKGLFMGDSYLERKAVEQADQERQQAELAKAQAAEKEKKGVL